MQAMTESLAFAPKRPDEEEVRLWGLRLVEGLPVQRMTRHLMASDPEAIAETAAAIRRGDLVVFPTDTLYGIGTNAFDEKAILSLYSTKKRPLEKGVPILLADVTDLEKIAKFVPQAAQGLIERFWPGPLTLIVPKKSTLPQAISTNEGVAVPTPDNETARAVIRAAGGAVATSSANRSGDPPAQSAEQALSGLAGAVAIVLDGGPTGQSMPSTIVDCTAKRMRILRQGAIGAELKQIEKSLE